MKFVPKRRFFRVEPPAPGGPAPSVMAFGMAKGGSTLLFNMLTWLAPKAGLTYFSIDDHLFRHNVAATQRPANIGPAIKPEGYCYGGFRQFPAYPVPILGRAKIIFLVRDPRDMITSLYYSLRSSHRLPEAEEQGGAREGMEKARELLQQTAIDLFATEAVRSYIRMFEGYVAQGFLWRQNVAVYRYEDVIFEKEAFVNDICDWYGWDIPLGIRRLVAKEFNELPDEERPDKHVRQVKPGNHKDRLSPATIAAIDDALSEYMDVFGYR